MTRSLICASMAFDTIMKFEDQFKNHILADQTHKLNVAFLAPEMVRHFGGCAGNIAYTLKLLGGEPVIMATVGEDFAMYADYLSELGLDQSHFQRVPGTFTAQAFLTTDIDQNQIITFHPGAMNEAHLNKIDDADDIGIGLVGPDGRQAMIEHAEQFLKAGIPFIFDPGQGLPMFDGDDLNKFVSQASYVIVNDYESEMLSERTGRNLVDLAKEVDALIVTRGSSGSQIHVAGESIEIPAVEISQAADPTGCGDAYRAGIIHGLNTGKDWKTCGQMAALCGGVKIEQMGPQNHKFSFEQFADRYKRSFGEEL